MKPRHDWHHTPLGRFALFIGGLRLAVPVMALVIAALAWGTYLDSTQGAKVAFRYVYASGWFIAIMALACVSLAAAVAVRFPWRRQHIGFITVHAGLLILIVGGFWSLFGRIEGRITLAEGTATSEIEINTQRLQLVERNAGGFAVIASTSAEDHVSGPLRLNDLDVEIVGRWGNIAQESYVANDGTEPLRAMHFGLGDGNDDGIWVAEAAKSGGPAFLHGVTVHVLGAGEAWTPPQTQPGDATEYEFNVGDDRYPLTEEGQEAFPGWTIVTLRRFTAAVVGADGLAEGEPGDHNPAVDVTITNGAGSTERHTAFEKFPDMVLGKAIEGDAASGARLKAPGAASQSLFIFGDPPTVRAAFVAADGSVQQFENDGVWPWSFQAGGHRFVIRGQVSHARMATRFVEAPAASEFRPALLVKISGGDVQPLPWKGSLPVNGPGQTFLQYGPRRVPLPFHVHLEEFRRTDYPGTNMAMAYESRVIVTTRDGNKEDLTISMNKPYAHGAWKTFQSGFINENISIFSVMRDPGLPLTYLGCVIMCVGIFLVFYVRRYSGGHPGISR